MNATAKFELDTWNENTTYEGPDATIGTVRITKTFSGEIAGTSTVDMVSVKTAVEGSMAYSALERFDVAIDGRAGSFVLHHHATAGGPNPSATWTIVPDSGAGDLAGISGQATITPEHGFVLEYEL